MTASPTEVGQRIPFFFQAEDGIRVVERSRGLGDVYKRQEKRFTAPEKRFTAPEKRFTAPGKRFTAPEN